MRAHEFVTEKKKRKRKPRWAAYGPGPFGGYGFAAGYSGDAGGDGGVGEASYDGNIGAMEVFKFMNTASGFEKDLLKKLIAQKAYAKAWALVQGVTGTKLKGKEFEVEEGWKDWVAGAALGVAALGANANQIVSQVVDKGDTIYSIARDNGVDPKVIMKLNGFGKDTKLQIGQEVKVPDVYKDADSKKTKPDVKKADKKSEPTKKKETKLDASKTLTGTVHEAVLTRTARAAGITDPIELAAFLAQCAHESHDFKSMVEYGGSLDFRKYDPKYAPKKAKSLGNKKIGDGARYKGRGYIQLTGRYNYKRAGQALGLPLEDKPQLAEKPEVAAKIAVWFWKQRVQPNVSNFNDVRSVTKPINPGLNGLDDRKEAFVDFKKFKLAAK